METIPLLNIARLFNIDTIETLIEIASFCEPSRNGDEKEGKSSISTFFEDRKAFVKRELDVIHDNGAKYYLSKHAKPYINMLSQDDVKRFVTCLEWGADNSTIEKYLCQLFEKCRLSFLAVNKEDFIYHAVRKGYNLGQEGQKVNFQLVNAIKHKINAELTIERDPTKNRELIIAITEREIKTTVDDKLKEILQVGLMSLNGTGYLKIANHTGKSEAWARKRRRDFISHMKDAHMLDVEPFMPQGQRSKKHT